MTVGLLLLATHKYKMFVQGILNDVKKHFLLNHNIEVYLFTDEIGRNYAGNGRVKIIEDLIPSYRFPLITLYRYRIFTSRTYPTCDYLFYSDVDVSICDTIGEEIFGNIVAVRHSGFYNGGGSWETNEKSTAYTFPDYIKHYYAGGVQGGEAKKYYRAMQDMKRMIDEDERNGIIPVWHDESAWNRFLSEYKSFKELTPEYCMVEQQHLREQWGVSHFKPKIIALDKNHAEIRS